MKKLFTIAVGLFITSISMAQCPAPISLDSFSSSPTEAIVAWFVGESETDWILISGISGFNPALSGDTLLVSGVSGTTLSGLNPCTDYDFYVIADCGGGILSPIAGPNSFTTQSTPPTTSSFPLTECDSYTVPSGDETYTTSGTYAVMDTIPNSVGCDSIMTITLTINSIDTSTSILGATITANTSSATYQWIDCNNGNNPVAGETNQSFTATANGSYAVVVTENSCSDTSSCVNITTVGISDNLFTNQISIYPNPTTDIVTLDFGNIENASFQIFNPVGKLIMEEKNINDNIYQLELNESSGVYLIKINSKGKSVNYKVIKE